MVVLGELDDQDGVLRAEADDGQQRHLEIDIVRQAAKHGGAQGADDAERDDHDDRDRDRPAFIKRGQKDKDDEDRQGVEHRRLRARLAFLQGQTRPFVGNAGGQGGDDLLDFGHGLP